MVSTAYRYYTRCCSRTKAFFFDVISARWACSPSSGHSNHSLTGLVFLTKRLSDYFGQPSNSVVGSISHIPSGLRDAGELSFFRHPIKTRDTSAINFKALLGEWQWKQTYKRVYEEQKGMWLTPCELFTPYYSNILANFVSTSMKASLSNNNDTFEIVELGGGRQVSHD